jgi:hypothetical protein
MKKNTDAAACQSMGMVKEKVLSESGMGWTAIASAHDVCFGILDALMEYTE